ncbi:MAG: RagB/SusD family nutrient uptake outer membrane protein [Mediterranea sp.]|jgi:tetratricopeptide (TPR) repeat protein|nr:RagB/SusD family nutrient uptake outer membrane protein [Mediterranea sp.]
MKKYILNIFVALSVCSGMSSCSNFFDTDYSKGVDVATGLSSVNNIETALNGTYYQLFYYGFAGNYALTIGDVPTDISYWNTDKKHWDSFYTFTVLDTDSYLKYIWNYGYKVVDNASRIIEASQNLYEHSTKEQQQTLNTCMAEAYALRGYAELMLTNIFGHQVKVNGEDFSSQPGIVVVNKPVPALTQVTRSTIGQSYNAVVSDLTQSLDMFKLAGGDRGELVYFGEAAVYGLLARTNLYLEKWDEAMQYAQQALDAAKITTLTYGKDNYKALYNTETSNTESMFALAITNNTNWSASSIGTLWESYGYSPSPKLLSLYGANDCRTSVFNYSKESTATKPIFTGGKFSHFSSGNPARGTCYIVNAPEMFLIIAEANLRSSKGTFANAQKALLIVAKRNADIASANDLPVTTDGLMSFLKDERARELFQEGFRLYDLRRWNEVVDVYAINAPNIDFIYHNYKIANLTFPVPADEINAGFGVEQTPGWADTLPERD